MNSEDKTFVMVNSFRVKRSKEVDDNNQTKNDLKDPKVIAKLVIAGRYSIPYVPDEMYSDLRILMNVRESESNQMIEIKNKLY